MAWLHVARLGPAGQDMDFLRLKPEDLNARQGTAMHGMAWRGIAGRDMDFLRPKLKDVKC
jgi:hypothetical protein